MVSERSVDSAEVNLRRLLPELVSWRGPEAPRFLDIGCGSGLHAVAAARLGASVTAIDIDETSVATTQAMVARLGVADKVSVRQASILTNDLSVQGGYDIVYSWGVLHHTGRVWEAIARSVDLLAPGKEARIALALYRPTRLDAFWKWEKRSYVRGGPVRRKSYELTAMAMWDVMRLMRGTTPRAYRRDYWHSRGMSFHHDLKDWLGGYPYESVSRSDLDAYLSRRGLQLSREFVADGGRVTSGIGGSGCDEFVYQWRS